METRIQNKIDDHLRNFKRSLQQWMIDNGGKIEDSLGNNKSAEFMQLLFDFEGLVLTKEDFQRRKRVKNQVPKNDRCCAKRANGEQCTRRKLDGMFCGTHKKGSPHGIVSSDQDQQSLVLEKVEIWMQEVNGINYFVDAEHNVYSPEDIVSNKQDPSIIGRWSSVVNESGMTTYSIVLSQ